MPEYEKLTEAPATYRPDVERGDWFEDDLDAETETALVAAGWVKLVKPKTKRASR